MGNVLVAKVMFQGPGVMTLIGELESVCVTQHVRMDRKRQVRGKIRVRPFGMAVMPRA
jgi:hypothetical protein